MVIQCLSSKQISCYEEYYMRPVVGFEGLYEIDEYGNVYSKDKLVNHNFGGLALKKGKLLSPERHKLGYLRVLLIDFDGKRCHKLIHRLVAEAYLPNPQNLSQINHKDGNKTNNHISNLEWCDSSYNNRHALLTGLRTGKKRGVCCKIQNKVFDSITNAAKYFNTSRYLVKKMGLTTIPYREYIEGATPSVEAQQ